MTIYWGDGTNTTTNPTGEKLHKLQIVCLQQKLLIMDKHLPIQD